MKTPRPSARVATSTMGTLSVPLRRGSALVLSLIVGTFAVIVTGAILTTLTQSRAMNFRQRHLADAKTASANMMEYLAAAIKVRLNTPSNSSPAIKLLNFILPAVSASDLGLDTNRYELTGVACATGTTALPGVAGFSSSTTTQDLISGPITLMDPAVRNTISSVWIIPFHASVSVRDKATGRITTVTAQSYLKQRNAPFMQYAYMFNGVTPTIVTGGSLKGRLFSNEGTPTNPTRYATWVGAGQGDSRARNQLDGISAPYISFSNLGAPTTHSNNTYLWAGDTNGDGRVTYMSKASGTLTADGVSSWVKTAVYSGAYNREFVPAYQTQHDFKGTPQEAAAGYNVASDTDSYAAPAYTSFSTKQLAKANITPLIDSANPNIANLAQRFNGNYKDASTGFQPSYPSSLPDALTKPDPITGIKDPAAARVLIEPPVNVAALPAAAQPKQQEIEDGKYSNKANFYILIETPTVAGTAPLPPIVFVDAAAAAAYKADAAGAADNAAKIALRANYAAAGKTRITPGGMIEVKRSFYNATQIKQNAGDPEMTQRVSAVDVDFGKLKTEVEADRVPGWNGIVYVDVTNPRSPGWVSYDKSGAPLAYNAAGSLVNAAGKSVADPLAATEQNLVAVRLHNAGSIPDGHGANGTTLATNTTVYTVGHVNADGSAATDANLINPAKLNDPRNAYASQGVTATEPIAPFSIAADGITNYGSSYKYQGTANGTLESGDLKLCTVGNNVSTINGDVAHRITNTLNASILEMNINLVIGGAGVMPKGVEGAFPLRYPIEEDRNGVTFRYRGSNNILFQSRYNRKYIDGTSKGYEGTNDIAFDAHLREGADRIPPGSPQARYYLVENSAITGIVTK